MSLNKGNMSIVIELRIFLSVLHWQKIDKLQDSRDLASTAFVWSTNNVKKDFTSHRS